MIPDNLDMKSFYKSYILQILLYLKSVKTTNINQRFIFLTSIFHICIYVNFLIQVIFLFWDEFKHVCDKSAKTTTRNYDTNYSTEH